MDAGGLAQMTYNYNNNNNFSSNGGLGVPTAGFASRGKGNHLKRLSAAAPPKIGSISEHPVNDQPTPRTSRSHLLAGLRTAPKTPGSVPQSAPFTQNQFGGSGNSKQAAFNAGSGYGGPQTAIGSGFSNGLQNQYGIAAGRQIYSLPEQVLAPPPVQFDHDDSTDIDPNLAAQLMATELYLQQRQQQLQQQLLSLTAQQFASMNLNGGNMRQQQYPMTPMTPQSGFYGQQFQQAQEAQAGLQVVYNPMTGQYQYVMDQNVQQPQLSDSPPPPTPSFTNSPPKSGTPTFRQSPPNERPNPFERNMRSSRSTSPPKKSQTPPVDVTPLPPPSANAFRRGHKKNVSSLTLSNLEGAADGPKSAFVRSVGFPQTPMTGTFGPGQARAGEHPARQPRGPPPLEELQAAPTAKHEGSKNFASRQRRSAVRNLVRAGIERRGVRSGSGGSGTPVSEADMSFPISDNDSDSVRSGSLSGKPSIGSLRAAASGAIGSERKASKERLRERTGSDGWTANTMSSDEEIVEVVTEESKGRKKTPMLVLTSAEKRKSSMF
ncbi:hypothetical protein MPH_02078 [Macrophomina phaseolina MS6]|uniref:Uncharacterized protein n=1 Tax=Macrophomina phaseolina (strain MS6) TaxID=1126212 RepID=K2RDH9_MACPH|nr:hypothetical protein MPH_02078 [Macrophomina phaseolina MS6]